MQAAPRGRVPARAPATAMCLARPGLASCTPAAAPGAAAGDPEDADAPESARRACRRAAVFGTVTGDGDKSDAPPSARPGTAARPGAVAGGERPEGSEVGFRVSATPSAAAWQRLGGERGEAEASESARRARRSAAVFGAASGDGDESSEESGGRTHRPGLPRPSLWGAAKRSPMCAAPTAAKLPSASSA